MPRVLQWWICKGTITLCGPHSMHCSFACMNQRMHTSLQQQHLHTCLARALIVRRAQMLSCNTPFQFLCAWHSSSFNLHRVLDYPVCTHMCMQALLLLATSSQKTSSQNQASLPAKHSSSPSP
jgi:hypothetical protein